MSEYGLVVFVAIAILGSLICHRVIPKRPLFASSIAAVFSSISFQIAAYFAQGYLDPFFPIALAFSFAICLLIAIVVGSLVRSARNSTNSENGPGSN